jgi:hypothetical protein
MLYTTKNPQLLDPVFHVNFKENITSTTFPLNFYLVDVDVLSVLQRKLVSSPIYFL